MIKRLEQLNREIAAANAEADSAEEAYLSATDVLQQAKCKKVWQVLGDYVKMLLEQRRALHAKLPGPGVHPPLLANNLRLSLPPLRVKHQEKISLKRVFSAVP